MRCSCKWHCSANGGEVPKYNESDFILALHQVRADVQRVIIPKQRAASGRPDGNVDAVDIEFVSGVGGEMKQGPVRP